MSKTKNMSRKDIRWHLLVTVSVSALLASAYGVGEAQAADNDSGRPSIWIELGGGLERLAQPQEAFTPSFMPAFATANMATTLNVQSPPDYGLEEEAKISYRPQNSDWIIAASVRFGRSQESRNTHQQTANQIITEHYILPIGGGIPKYHAFYPTVHAKFADGQSHLTERHTFLEFEAGKDLGLGMFGIRGSSVVSAGVRIAQLQSRSSVDLRGEPDVHYTPAAPITSFVAAHAFKYQNNHFHDYHGSAAFERDFHGIGPSLSWNASVPVLGNDDTEGLALNWGLEAAVLFGRQTARGHHQTTSKAYDLNYLYQGFKSGNVTRVVFGNPGSDCGGVLVVGQRAQPCLPTSTTFGPPRDINRSRQVTVPDVGATIGVSYIYENAKINFGYRAEILFGAMDGGIDAAKSENRSFMGPYASISIGLGD